MSSNTPYELVCGLEIHAELKTDSKMFCSCKNDPFGAEKPNSYTCPVCLGMPGGIPVANKKAIDWTLKLGLALNCEINLFSKFDRKNYFYPDLAKGYQISQYDIPFCVNGYIDTSEGRIRIRRIHLEEDTAKLLHKKINGEDATLIDFNRSGVPLVEIVTEADIISASQAKEYGKKIRQILRYLQIADCDMEQGGMRLEANVSIRKVGESELPKYKVEVKNINSFRFLEQAITYEVGRHTELLTNQETPKQETRGWNAELGKTFSQRTKEDAEDYRYFPDPDLPPLRFTEEYVSSIKAALPEALSTIEERWQAKFLVKAIDVETLLNELELLPEINTLFEKAVAQKIDAAKVASALINKKISLAEGADEALLQFTKENTTEQVDEKVLRELLTKIIASHPTEFARFQAGETKLANVFIGMVMRELKQKIDTKKIIDILNTLGA